MENLCNTYKNGTVALKQDVIGSIFSKKLVFDGNKCRTQNINQAVLLILSVGRRFSKNKSEQLPLNKQLFAWVEPEGLTNKR